ncbi:DUF4826 family protein [Ferrimonas marina]|uniref:DUF4826 domain-containing protein n=1 Tax=Ferrimonas marina TaxID=299255 RepID=A0A1M5N1P5_9GAMM|nr:DUF4826 family protein [Ferrimonas marina]SHG83484.1 protein of unknown function [Ferrimonas marina]
MADVMDQEQQQAWVREQFQKANRHLAEKGILPGRVLEKESRYLPPLIALWKMEDQSPQKRRYWVLSGDLPTDLVADSAAKDAREALRHFALSWQLKGENLRKSQDKTQQDLARLLIGRAEGLSQLHQDERLWVNEA